MDQVPIIPVSTTVTVTAVEAQTQTADAAIPNPNAPTTFSHPPYAEMIYSAIAALNERNGSSKGAIAKYIERVYSGLPPTHLTLVSHQLKLLKNSGRLIMVKKSYQLPSSDSAPSSAPQTARRGHPSKPKPNPGPTSNDRPVSVPIGLVGEPGLIERSRGRPRKSGTSVVGQSGSVLGKRGRGRPPGPKKMTPGRPPKAKISSLGSNGLKRGRGRPPKTIVIPYASTIAGSFLALPATVADSSVTVGNGPRPRGRPKKSVTATAGGNIGGVNGGNVNLFSAKQRGRPRKSNGVRKSVGRPKKNAQPTTNEAAPDNLLVDYEQLKAKLDLFQSKVKQAVGVLRPHFYSEGGSFVVIEALQDLEALTNLAP